MGLKLEIDVWISPGKMISDPVNFHLNKLEHGVNYSCTLEPSRGDKEALPRCLLANLASYGKNNKIQNVKSLV